MPIFLLILALAGGIFGVRHFKKRALRKELLQSPLLDGEWEIVVQHVPLVQKLPRELRPKLEGKMSLFLHQVDFVGCAGLEITEDMQLSIAAQACLLVVNSDAWYTTLRTVFVYPSAFKSKTTTRQGYVTQERDVVRLGESWTRGPVILSWAHTAQGAINDVDGKNVVLHEFAHQLDSLSGNTNGLPLLNKRQSFVEWERVVLDAYARHLRHVEDNRKTVLDAYGAQNHEEFFAVAIEVFFEKPVRLAKEEPELYAQLSKLLRLDTAKWD